MQWDAIGAVGELIGALGVIASLVYLALQIRTSNRLARVEAFRAPTSVLNSMNAQYMLVPEFREAFPSVYAGALRAEIDPQHLFVIDSYMVSITNIFEQLYREQQEKIIDERALADNSVAPIFHSPYYRSSWHLYKRAYGTSFVQDFEKQFNLSESAKSSRLSNSTMT